MALLDIVHEDDDLLIVNKPAGLVCHPTKDGERSSLVGRVRLHLDGANGHLVNRLDRETSGLVCLAKHAAAAGELGRLLAAGAFEKTYTAIVHGAIDGPRAIDAPLGRDESSAVAIKDCVRPDGARAVTVIRPRATARGDAGWSLIDVAPRTGRKHQIRIHLAHIGHPIVGDKIYGPDEQLYLRFIRGELSDADRAVLRVEHHALHAQRLAFEWRGVDRVFTAPAPDEFSALAVATGLAGVLAPAVGAPDTEAGESERLLER